MSQATRKTGAGSKKDQGKFAGMKAPGNVDAGKKAPVTAAAPAAPDSGKKLTISAEERFRMIQVAAYYAAEQDGFAGDPTGYWTQGERKISELLGD